MVQAGTLNTVIWRTKLTEIIGGFKMNLCECLLFNDIDNEKFYSMYESDFKYFKDVPYHIPCFYTGYYEKAHIEHFLSVYFGKSVKLTAVVQCCNQASGFPYWCFFYQER